MIPQECPNPTNDFVFCYMMGCTGCEPAVQSFINAIQLDSHRPLAKQVRIVSPFDTAGFVNGKKSIVDVRAVGEDNRNYHIEIQTSEQKNFNNRILYYWSGIYHSQLYQSEAYTELNPVISIALTHFTLFPDLPNLHNVFTIRSEENPEINFSDHLEIHTVELTRKKMQSTTTIDPNLVNWYEFLTTNYSDWTKTIDRLQDDNPGLAHAMQRYEFLCKDRDLRGQALAEEKAERDRIGQLNFAREQGLEQGLEQGTLNTLRENILHLYSRRFGAAHLAEVSVILQSIADQTKLNAILDMTIDCTTDEAFLKELESM